MVPTPHNPASATATPVTAAVVAAMAASAQGDVTDVSPESPLEVVALGEELSEEVIEFWVQQHSREKDLKNDKLDEIGSELTRQ